jgi:hypothetical protein
MYIVFFFLHEYIPMDSVVDFGFFGFRISDYMMLKNMNNGTIDLTGRWSYK